MRQKYLLGFINIWSHCVDHGAMFCMNFVLQKIIFKDLRMHNCLCVMQISLPWWGLVTLVLKTSLAGWHKPW